MWHELVDDESKFFTCLIEWDKSQAAAVQARGCPCGGRLDRADYPRKVRGVPGQWDEAFSRRISLCCAKEGCRRRRTPASVRFLGRRVYGAAVVLAVSAGWLCHAVIPSRTVRRWREYFRTRFVSSTFWRESRSRLMPPVNELALPRSLLERFTRNRAIALRQALSFLSPITSQSSSVVMVG